MALPGWDRWRNKEEEKERGRGKDEQEIICEEDRGTEKGVKGKEVKWKSYSNCIDITAMCAEHHTFVAVLWKKASLKHYLAFALSLSLK